MTRGGWMFVGVLLWLWPVIASAQERPFERGWGTHPDVGGLGSMGHRDDVDDAQLLGW